MIKLLSIEDAYLWVQRFVAREWRLMLPVALAFMALPTLVLLLVAPQSAQLDPATVAKNPAAAMNVLAWLAPAQIVIFIIGSAGWLAITAMALVPGISVREALAVAARRLGILIASLLLIAVGELILLVVGVVALTFARVPPIAIQSVMVSAFLILNIFVVIRLVPLTPMIVRRRIGPASALRESWIMTAGVSWRIFGAVMIYSVGAFVVVLALTTGVGTVLLLSGKAIGSPELGSALGAIVACAVGAVARVGFYLLSAAIFRQLDGSSRGA